MVSERKCGGDWHCGHLMEMQLEFSKLHIFFVFNFFHKFLYFHDEEKSRL